MIRQNKIALLCTVILAAGSILSACGKQEESYRNVKILEMQGISYVTRAEKEMPLYAEMMIQGGDLLRTEIDSSVGLSLDDDKYLLVEESSEVEFELKGEKNNGAICIHLHAGAVYNEIDNPLGENDSYEIHTPDGVMAVRGTKFRVAISDAADNENRRTIVSVAQGEVQVSLYNSEEEQETLSAGEEAVIEMKDENGSGQEGKREPAFQRVGSSSPSGPQNDPAASSTPTAAAMPTGTSAPTASSTPEQPSPVPTASPTPARRPRVAATPTPTIAPVPTETPRPLPPPAGNQETYTGEEDTGGSDAGGSDAGAGNAGQDTSANTSQSGSGSNVPASGGTSTTNPNAGSTVSPTQDPNAGSTVSPTQDPNAGSTVGPTPTETPTAIPAPTATPTTDPGAGSTESPSPGGSATTDPGTGSTESPSPGGSTTTDPGTGSTESPSPGGGATTDPGTGSTESPSPGGGATTDPGTGSTESPSPGGGATTDPDAGATPGTTP